MGHHLCIKVLEAANIKTEGCRRNAVLKICRHEAQQAADVPGNAVTVNGLCVLTQREAIGGQMGTSEKYLCPGTSLRLRDLSVRQALDIHSAAAAALSFSAASFSLSFADEMIKFHAPACEIPTKAHY